MNDDLNYLYFLLCRIGKISGHGAIEMQDHLQSLSDHLDDQDRRIAALEAALIKGETK